MTTEFAVSSTSVDAVWSSSAENFAVRLELFLLFIHKNIDNVAISCLIDLH